MASSPLTIILQLISEQYMVELHSLPGRYTIFWYLADYVNTLSPIWFTLDNNTNPSGFSHIYTRRSFCLILYISIVIRHIPRCVIRHLLHFGLSYICIYQPIVLHPNTLRFLYRLGVVETRVPGGASSIPRAHTRECHGNWHHPISIVVQNTTLTPTIKRETRLYQGMSHMYK